MERNLYEVLLKAKDGNEEAKEYILEKYEPMIVNRAMSYFIKGYETEDLIQIARFTTLTAIEKFDLESKSNFTSYLDRAIKNNLGNLLRKTVKTHYEASLDFKISEEDDLLDVLASEDLTDEEVIMKFVREDLILLLSKLSKEDFELLKFVYFENKTLSEWTRKTNQKYYEARKRRDYLLEFLKRKLS
ncbi:MAG: sigma-70 family RNA polymerase sigma factor [Sarcina sp.]